MDWVKPKKQTRVLISLVDKLIPRMGMAYVPTHYGGTLIIDPRHIYVNIESNSTNYGANEPHGKLLFAPRQQEGRKYLESWQIIHRFLSLLKLTLY